jgi:hypothetical protein
LPIASENKTGHSGFQTRPLGSETGQYQLQGAVVAYMSVSTNYKDFMEKLDRFRPRFSEQYELPLEYQADEDTGIGL